jgi:hypothetical protein
MDEEPKFYQRPGFGIAVTIIFWLIWYVVQLYRMDGGILANIQRYFILHGFLCFVGLLVWLAFFAQFVLPVRTLRDRQKIFERLTSYFGLPGPAIFIRNGVIVSRQDEQQRRAPGVIWLDSASAAVLRNKVRFTRVVGPGVHFTNTNEYIAGTVDLHKQSHRIGPRGDEDPFAEKRPEQSEAEYQEIQKRRNETRAMTRDGIEVVPDMLITFRIDADPASGDQPGSRFGFDEEAVRRAITGQGINPNAPQETSRSQVAWNRLPAMLAADLWREYLARFPLNELFQYLPPAMPVDPTIGLPAVPEPVAAPVELPAETGLRAALTDMLKVLNGMVEGLAIRLEGGRKAKAEPEPQASGTAPARPAEKPSAAQPSLETAIQLINRMVKARLTQPRVDEIDAFGRPTGRRIDSPEYHLLKERGIRIAMAITFNLRFNRAVDEQIAARWSSTWLDTAKKEQEYVRRLHNVRTMDGKDSALFDYVDGLCRDMTQSLKKNKARPGKAETLRHLLRNTRTQLARNNKLQQRLNTEIDELTEIIRRLEKTDLK